MMTKKSFSILFLAVILGGYSVHIFAAVDAEWSERMRKLLSSFTLLAPYIYSDKSFNDPQNKDEIAKRISEFSNLSHRVEMHAGKGPGGDPSLKFIAEHLKQDATEALSAFKMDNREYARYKLKKISQNCFQCHSQQALGPQFEAFNVKMEEASMKRTELANVYVATRQFDKALATLEKELDESDSAKKDTVEFQRAIRNYLAIAVRVKQDPNLAGSFVEKALKNKNTPQYLKDDAARWKIDIDQWKAENKKAASKVANFTRAVQLVDKAKDLQEYLMDSKSDVLYLRATALLHDFLLTSTDKKKTAEAMYYLGHCYEVLNDIGQWFLQETYFESCIRTLPNSVIARKCYNRYEVNVFLGYSGSGGVYIPETEKERLQSLHKLAFGK